MPRWSSTNLAVIVIDSTGKATAVGEGNASIEVSGHGQRVTRSIQVTQRQQGDPSTRKQMPKKLSDSKNPCKSNRAQADEKT